MPTTIKFRPHHFLCALCFQGKGYSSAFVANFSAIMQQLNDAEIDTAIEVVNYTDAICSPCPHAQGKLCETQEKITVLDQAHAEALAVKSGDILNWDEAKERIKKNITLEKFDTICQGCEWKASGMCENVLSKFLVK